MLNKILLLLLLLSAPGLLRAQEQNYDLFRLQYHYERVEFREAIAAGRKALQESASLDREQLVSAHKYMAFSFFNLSQNDSARFHFFSLLSLKPDYEPGQAEASPKLRSFFDEIRKAYRSNNPTSAAESSLTRYVFVQDKRPAAAWRSMVLPGWGQYYKEQEQRAYYVGGGFATLGLATLGSYILERSYRSDYLDSNEPARIQELYDRYNTTQKWRKGLTLATAAFWLWNVGDALWRDYPALKMQARHSGSSVLLSLQVAL